MSDQNAPTSPLARAVRLRARIVVAYLVCFVLAVTWPGAMFFNGFEPQILGLPFNLAWPTFWVLLGFVVLVWLNFAVEARDDEGADSSASSSAGVS